MNTKSLEKFGLSEREGKVYLALLELGSGSVSEIATKAKINRTTTYDVLEYLNRYSLVSHVGEKKKKFYTAENPENLAKYLDNKCEEFRAKREAVKTLLPELKGMFNQAPHKPKVKYYDGDEGIIAMYEDSLTSKTEILSWLDTSKTYDFSAEYFSDYYKKRAALNIHIKAIVNESPLSREIAQRDEIEDRETLLINPRLMQLEPECYIYDNKVAFFSLRERFGVMIESADIANAQRKLYELAWERAKELDKK